MARLYRGYRVWGTIIIEIVTIQGPSIFQSIIEIIKLYFSISYIVRFVSSNDAI